MYVDVAAPLCGTMKRLFVLHICNRTESQEEVTPTQIISKADHPAEQLELTQVTGTEEPMESQQEVVPTQIFSEADHPAERLQPTQVMETDEDHDVIDLTEDGDKSPTQKSPPGRGVEPSGRLPVPVLG